MLSGGDINFERAVTDGEGDFPKDDDFARCEEIEEEVKPLALCLGHVELISEHTHWGGRITELRFSRAERHKR